MSAIQLVCFDVGRVLLPICNGWRHACDLIGIPYPPAACDPRIHTQMLHLGEEYEVGHIDHDTFCRQTAQLSGLTEQQVHRCSTAWLLEPYEGVDQLIEDVCSTPVQTACLSNTCAHHWSIMFDKSGNRHLGLDRLDFRFASHLIGHAKPDAAIYEHVETATGIAPGIAPGGGGILFFDDHPPNIAAAAARQWRTCRVDPADDVIAQLRRCLRQYDIL